MYLPYVYKLTHKETGQFYIGSRYSKGINFFPEKDILQYQTSSKVIKQLGFENFIVEIIAVFFKGIDAWDHEQVLILENIGNNLILNKRHQKSSSGFRFINYEISDKTRFFERTKKTNLLKYGCEFVVQSDRFKKKRIETVNSKYHVDFILQVASIREKSKITMLRKYGVEHMTQSVEFKKIRSEKINAKFGVDSMNKIELICPHCKKAGKGYGAMYRYHFDKCKFKIIQEQKFY